MLARKFWAYGIEKSYFSDSATCIGFTRLGHASKSGGAGLAVLANTSWEYDVKRMYVGVKHAGESWTDLLRQVIGKVVVDENGYGEFSVGPRGVSVWVSQEALGRDVVDSFIL
jgi:alpha-amylase